MAVYTGCICAKCFRTFDGIEDSSIDSSKLCPDCITKEDEKRFREKENKRDNWLYERAEFTTEERLKFIEEWVYDHKN